MNLKDINRTIDIISEITKNKSKGLHEPNFCGQEIKFLSNSIRNKSVSTYGEESSKFEKEIKKITKTKHVISVINGTSALQLSLYTAGIDNNCEVLIPALNYIASANATINVGGSPHFVDVEEKSLGVDFKKLDIYLKKISIKKNNKYFNIKTKKHIKAIVVTHVFGHPCDLEMAKKISKKYNLILIEDAAEALGSFYKKKHLGTFGHIGILSFNGNKIITTGGGGAVLTNNSKIAKKINHISRNSRVKKNIWEYTHNELGFNFRMPSLNANLGIAQIKNLKLFLKNKRKLFERYKILFNDLNDFEILQEPRYAKSNYWLNDLILKKPDKKTIIKLLKIAAKKKIQLRPVWKILSKNKYLNNFPRMNLSCANNLEKRIINIPSSSNL
jgi:perosamine synthetase